jgi:hypothetical protein
MVAVAKPVAALAHRLIRRRDAVHRALRAEVAALVEQRGVDLRRRQVHEARLVQSVEVVTRSSFQNVAHVVAPLVGLYRMSVDGKGETRVGPPGRASLTSGHEPPRKRPVMKEWTSGAPLLGGAAGYAGRTLLEEPDRGRRRAQRRRMAAYCVVRSCVVSATGDSM